MAIWNIDPAHTQVNFSVKHMMVSTVRGTFSDVNGSIQFDPANPASGSVEVTIDPNTIYTGAADRDNHLRSPDFFDVVNYPTVSFKSTTVQVTGDNKGKISGDLTIRDVTKPVTLDVTFDGEGVDPWGNKRVGFTGETQINREDFGLTWNQALEAGGVLVGKDIKLSLEVQAVLASVTETA